MSSIAQDLDETLQRIDPQAAQRVERLVREILALAKSRASGNGAGPSLLDLEASAEASAEEPTVVADPIAAIGFARRYGLEEGSTDEYLKELREGEDSWGDRH